MKYTTIALSALSTLTLFSPSVTAAAIRRSSYEGYSLTFKTSDGGKQVVQADEKGNIFQSLKGVLVFVAIDDKQDIAQCIVKDVHGNQIRKFGGKDIEQTEIEFEKDDGKQAKVIVCAIGSYEKDGAGKWEDVPSKPEGGDNEEKPKPDWEDSPPPPKETKWEEVPAPPPPSKTTTPPPPPPKETKWEEVPAPPPPKETKWEEVPAPPPPSKTTIPPPPPKETKWEEVPAPPPPPPPPSKTTTPPPPPPKETKWEEVPVPEKPEEPKKWEDTPAPPPPPPPPSTTVAPPPKETKWEEVPKPEEPKPWADNDEPEPPVKEEPKNEGWGDIRDGKGEHGYQQKDQDKYGYGGGPQGGRDEDY